MGTVGSDLRLALRHLIRSPGFSVLSVAVLALGIGGTLAIFTVLDHAVLRPLPYDEAERLVYIDAEMPGESAEDELGLTEAGYFHILDSNRAFETLGAYGGAESGHELTIVGEEGGYRVDAAYVSHTLLEALRARPAVGRLFREEDDGWMRAEVGVLSVMVLGYDFWQREYGGDPDVVGRTLRIDGELPLEVIGVMSRGFQMPQGPVDIWLPLGLHRSRSPDSFHGQRVIARLAAGATLSDAAADLARLDAQLPEVVPEVYSEAFMEESGFRTRATPLRARVLGGMDEVLWILFGSIGLVLLIACSNVTNLFLARAEARRRDRAIRRALGGGRWRLARQILAETTLLSLTSAALGLWLADAGVRVLLAVVPTGLPRLDDVAIAGPSVIAALVIGVLAAFGFSAVLLSAHSPDLAALRDGGDRTTASKSSHRVRRAMIVTQIALALVLLTGAGMMLRSFERLSAVEPGFDPTDLLVVNLHAPATREYMQPAAVQQFYRELITRVSALPGVREASAGDLPQTAGLVCLDLFAEDRPIQPGRPPPCVSQSTMAPGFLQALEIPLRGRGVAWAEPGVGRDPWTDGEVIVTRALAERLWPGEDPIGKGIRLREAGPPYARVVGVTGDLHLTGLDRPPTEHVFGQLWYPSHGIYARMVDGETTAVADGIRRTIRELDPNVAVGSIRTMEEVVASSPAMARTSLTLLLLGIGAVTGLLLSAVGLFGVLAYLVIQRRGEIGIRMALGSTTRRVSAMIVGDSLKFGALGVALGIAAAIPSTRLLRSLLFEVAPGDPIAVGLAALVLLVVVVLASWIPARRAARVDPMTVLKAD